MSNAWPTGYALEVKKPHEIRIRTAGVPGRVFGRFGVNILQLWGIK